MSRLTDLIRQVARTDDVLAADLQREVSALADRRSFGLNFERHVPEAVELPGRPVRRGDKVRILPPRGEKRTVADKRIWRVVGTTIGDTDVEVSPLDDDAARTTVSGEDLVVVAEFRDPIYPGLVSTGTVERGADKPFHTVINAENYHALQALLFTHRGKVDAIYIDPPYNSGAKDWKYNNDYVEGDDLYRHSKWLAMLERRLLLAKALLKPEDSVLIVTIDEKEYLRLGLLLSQTFPDCRLQMISTVINPQGTSRVNEFSRTNEFIFVVMLGKSTIVPGLDNMFDRDGSEAQAGVEWRNLRRRERTSHRGSRPHQFYAVFVDERDGTINSVGDPLSDDVDRASVECPPGTRAVFPLKPNGEEMIWGVVPESLRELVASGYARSTPDTIQYLPTGVRRGIESGEIVVSGHDDQHAVIAEYVEGERRPMPKTVWMRDSHNAQASGTLLLTRILPGREFPFPKSLYAVEDVLRFFVAGKGDATVLDFFAGSGTTAHAVMRLNKQDGGQRRSISVTNNEVSADEQAQLIARGLRPGEPEWEELGICEHVTKPRISSAISGVNPDGEPIAGDYKFTDEFPMADGFDENVEFFTLTYEAPLRVASNRDFDRLAPLFWLRAGSRGRRIVNVAEGWDVAEAYGVLADLDSTGPFVSAVADAPDVKLAFIITDEDRLFEAVVRELPDHVEPVRLYESYLRTFELSRGGRNK